MKGEEEVVEDRSDGQIVEVLVAQGRLGGDALGGVVPHEFLHSQASSKNLLQKNQNNNKYQCV